MPTKFTLFLCPDDLLAKAKAKAARDRRSLSNYIITLIDKDVAHMQIPANGKSPAKLKAAVKVSKAKKD